MLGTLKENETVQIFGFDQEWLFCWRSDVGTYFIGRHNVDNITPPYPTTSRPTASSATPMSPQRRWIRHFMLLQTKTLEELVSIRGRFAAERLADSGRMGRCAV